MRKILICGLGAVGLTYAVKFKANSELKILVDKERLKRYTQNKPVFNGIVQNFEYILPDKLYFYKSCNLLLYQISSRSILLEDKGNPCKSCTLFFIPIF